jgi:hypothetical protein
MSAPLLPLPAYCADRAKLPHRERLTESDAELLRVGVLLSRCHQIRRVPQSVEHVRSLHAECLSLARAIVGAAGVTPTWNHREPPVSLVVLSQAVRAIAGVAEDGGALRLANVLLHLVFEALRGENEPVERGRIIAQRARVARKCGEFEAAEALYLDTKARALRLESDELYARASVGLGMLARTRGNLPAMREHFALAMTAAERDGSREVTALAHHCLMLSAATEGAFDVAILHAWAAFQDVRGDRVREADALLNIGQALLDCGEPGVALRAFVASLRRRPPVRLELPALGGLAMALAAEGNAHALQRVIARVDHLSTSADFQYEAAAAGADVVSALAMLHDAATEARRRSVWHAATEAGFHEIEFRMEFLTVTPGTPRRETQAPAQVSDVMNSVDALSDESELYAFL